VPYKTFGIVEGAERRLSRFQPNTPNTIAESLKSTQTHLSRRDSSISGATQTDLSAGRLELRDAPKPLSVPRTYTVIHLYMANSLQRFTLPDGRVYTDNDELYLPSVSTVLDEMPEPDGITYWKEKYDGVGDTKHWRDILQYKGNRGTLIHYNLLNQLVDGDMYSVDEEQSEEELKVEGDWHRYKDDSVYADEAWQRICDMRGIHSDNVLNVECFVKNTNIGYAGQFDLLYLDDDSNVVLSDIKTSNAEYAPYEKHKLQLVAYENALELDVDTLEVLIIHPDSERWKISHDSDWSEDRDELWEQFCELRTTMGNVEDRMKEIASDGVDDG
jgi:hypothetical protein